MAFWVSCCLHPGGCGASFLDELGRLGIGLRHHFLALGFGPGQFGLYFLGIGQTLGDLLTPLFQHLKDWSIGKPVKKNAHDAEADDLGEQVRPVHTRNVRAICFDSARRWPVILHSKTNEHSYDRITRKGLGAEHRTALTLRPTISPYFTRNRA